MNVGKKVLLGIIFLLVLRLTFLPINLSAQPDYEQELIKDTPVIKGGDLVKIIFNVIQYFLGFLGVLATLMIIYGGFLWMTAAGNDEKVQREKKPFSAA